MNVKLVMLQAYELFGGYAYMPYALAMKAALGYGENSVASAAICSAGGHEVADTESADIVLVVVERCPCCAGGAKTTVRDYINRGARVVTVCPLPGVDTQGEKYDFHMEERISFDDPKHPDRQQRDLAEGKAAITPELWRTRVIEGIAKALA